MARSKTTKSYSKARPAAADKPSSGTPRSSENKALWGSQSWLQPAFSRLLRSCARQFLSQREFLSGQFRDTLFLYSTNSERLVKKSSHRINYNRKFEGKES